MSDIFISYASADREHARQLAEALTRRGHAVWWDRTIPPGRVFDEVIQEAIHDARCMIVLWSAASVRSNWVKTEASEGAARGILVPALTADVLPPMEFRRIQAANLTAWDGDETHAECRNLLDSVERMLKQPPRSAAVAGEAPRVVQAARPAPASASTLQTLRTFAFGALVTLAVVGGYWLYGNADKVAGQPAAANKVAPLAAASDAAKRVANADPPAAGGARVNLLSAEQGGQVLAASSERWKEVIDGKEDTYAWADDGFGVFGFRDGRTALIDTLTVLVPKQSSNNMRDFELFVGDGAPTGPFQSIGKFSTQNMRMMQDPYQAFSFAPVKAKYVKLQSLRAHDNSTTCQLYEIQLLGRLQ